MHGSTQFLDTLYLSLYQLCYLRLLSYVYICIYGKIHMHLKLSIYIQTYFESGSHGGAVNHTGTAIYVTGFAKTLRLCTHSQGTVFTANQ